jgi:hypothetical protein
MGTMLLPDGNHCSKEWEGEAKDEPKSGYLLAIINMVFAARDLCLFLFFSINFYCEYRRGTDAAYFIIFFCHFLGVFATFFKACF